MICKYIYGVIFIGIPADFFKPKMYSWTLRTKSSCQFLIYGVIFIEIPAGVFKPKIIFQQIMISWGWYLVDRDSWYMKSRLMEDLICMMCVFLLYEITPNEGPDLCDVCVDIYKKFNELKHVPNSTVYRNQQRSFRILLLQQLY